MRLKKDLDRYVFECTYDDRMVAKQAGFWWDPKRKQWWTNDSEIAAKLSGYADEELAVGLAEVLKTREEAIEASRAVDADIEIPVPEGKAYMPFQKAGIAYAMARESTLIGDEMGLGKTIEAIGVINLDPTIKKVLVICPATLKLNWQREMEAWLTRPFRIMTVSSGDGWPNLADVIIINYDILAKYIDSIRATSFDLLIVDECHYCKNHKARRTQLVFGHWEKEPENRIPPIEARRRLYLTGTPILNKPIELWSLVHSLDPQGIGKSWYAFVKRYCGLIEGEYGKDVSGATNLEELQERLQAALMIRRLKADVLTELPAKRRQIVELEPDAIEREAVAAEMTAWQRAERDLEELRVNVELAKAGDSDDAYKVAVDKLTEGAGAAFAEISRLRHNTAVAKAPQVIEHLRGVLESEEQVVCFAHHHDVIDAIVRAFDGQACVLDGRTKMQDRQKAVDIFQKGGRRLFVGSISAAGLGITLTAASHAVFAELDWVPGRITQAEDRLHRIGQRDSVLVQHLVLDGSLDARMAKVLVDKQEIVDRALDRKPEPTSPAIPSSKHGLATESITRAKIIKEAEGMDPNKITEIHEKLRILAGVCDGARDLDGMGFSKVDARIGHSLAECGYLTPRQAVIGMRLAHKYRRQVGELSWRKESSLIKTG